MSCPHSCTPAPSCTPVQLHTCPAVRSLLSQLVKVYKPLRKAQKGFWDVIHLILKCQEVKLQPIRAQFHNKLRALIGCTPSYEPTVPDSISVTFSSLTNAHNTIARPTVESKHSTEWGVCVCEPFRLDYKCCRVAGKIHQVGQSLGKISRLREMSPI